MERKAQLKPKHLAQKLRQIRDTLGLSQNEIIVQMGLTNELTRSRISEYEAGYGPPLVVLLHYARLANIIVDVLIDDALELPTKLPSRTRSVGQKRET